MYLNLPIVVSFVLEDESRFSVEVGFFDSFKEIKEKIKKHKDIPVDRQKLMFEGKVLENEDSIFNHAISEGSRVQLLVTEPSKVKFMVRILDFEHNKKPLSVEMNLNDTVLQLKEKIFHAKQPLNFRLVEMEVRTKWGQELQDHRSLRDCGILNISHVYARKRIPQPGFDIHFGKRPTTVMVVPKNGTDTIPIEVNGQCCVEDLRFELDKFYTHALPQNGQYFFINNKTGNMISEKYTFDWHRIKDGDTIQITPYQVID
ncbi:hypothetical protein VNO78_19308 [Psophocarpus tetragonolobus]|uniref:Ubiquitin-like domain-containing protein n=1 Tax=Psophocarpus tetragonolobus TaxID=3891 RepID=A0AAN9SBC9_PSOTE